MIPKIAHFHWTGPPLSWLRIVSIASFKKFNPTWEIRLHDTPPEIRQYGLQYNQESDWTWWKVLARHGGFQVATDIVFLKPVPNQWLNCRLNACKNGTDRIYQFAMLGAVPGHPAMLRSAQACHEIASSKPPGDQAMGTDLLKNTGSSFLRGPDFFDQPMNALCAFSSADSDVGQLWGAAPRMIPKEAIGIHWYGGHKLSKQMEPKAKPGHHSFLVRLAESVFP